MTYTARQTKRTTDNGFEWAISKIMSMQLEPIPEGPAKRAAAEERATIARYNGRGFNLRARKVDDGSIVIESHSLSHYWSKVHGLDPVHTYTEAMACMRRLAKGWAKLRRSRQA